MTNNHHVLIAEGDEALRNRLYRRLLDVGVFADSAADGAEALRKLDERAYAMMVLDLALPVVDGVTVIERVRKFELAERPMLLVTANRGATPALDNELVQIVLRKPYDVLQLADVIGNCLRSLAEHPKHAARRPDDSRDRAEA